MLCVLSAKLSRQLGMKCMLPGSLASWAADLFFRIRAGNSVWEARPRATVGWKQKRLLTCTLQYPKELRASRYYVCVHVTFYDAISLYTRHLTCKRVLFSPYMEHSPTHTIGEHGIYIFLGEHRIHILRIRFSSNTVNKSAHGTAVYCFLQKHPWP
jgi:hypothetical protein